MAGEEWETPDKVPANEMLIPRKPLEVGALNTGARRIQLDNSNSKIIRVLTKGGYIVEVELEKIKSIQLMNGEQIQIQ